MSIAAISGVSGVPAGFNPGGSSTPVVMTAPVVASTANASPSGGLSGVLPVGTYLLGGFVALAAANTRAGPLVVGFLIAACLYNAGQILPYVTGRSKVVKA